MKNNIKKNQRASSYLHHLHSLLGPTQYILWATDSARGFCALFEEKELKKNFRGQIFFLVGNILKILVVFG